MARQVANLRIGPDGPLQPEVALHVITGGEILQKGGETDVGAGGDNNLHQLHSSVKIISTTKNNFHHERLFPPIAFKGEK